MSGARTVREVARREVVERWRSRTLRVSFVIVLLVAVGAAVAAARLAGGTPTDHVGLVGERSVAVQPAIEASARSAGRELVVRRLADDAAARSALREGDVEVVLLDGRRLLVEDDRSEPAVGVVQSALAASVAAERLRAAGLPLPVDELDPQAGEDERNEDLVALGLAVLLMALIGFGNVVASSVTEEKGSRVVEVLLTAVPPRLLLAGKIVGIGLLGLAQLVVVGAAALVAGRLAGGEGLPSAAPETVGLVVLWFVLGYAFYSVVFAAVGALVSRQEDLQSSAAPLTMLVLVAFYAGLAAIQSPDATLVEIGAFVPPLSPMLVPARAAMGDMSVLALVATVVIQVVAIVAMVLLAARVYERAILQVGAPVKLRHALAARGRRPAE